MTEAETYLYWSDICTNLHNYPAYPFSSAFAFLVWGAATKKGWGKISLSNEQKATAAHHMPLVSVPSQAENPLSLGSLSCKAKAQVWGCLSSPSQGSLNSPCSPAAPAHTCPAGTKPAQLQSEPRAGTGNSHLCQGHPVQRYGSKAQPGLCCSQRFMDRDGRIVMNTSSLFSKWNLKKLRHKGKFGEEKNLVEEAWLCCVSNNISKEEAEEKQRKVISWGSHG